MIRIHSHAHTKHTRWIFVILENRGILRNPSRNLKIAFSGGGALLLVAPPSRGGGGDSLCARKEKTISRVQSRLGMEGRRRWDGSITTEYIAEAFTLSIIRLFALEMVIIATLTFQQLSAVR